MYIRSIAIVRKMVKKYFQANAFLTGWCEAQRNTSRVQKNVMKCLVFYLSIPTIVAVWYILVILLSLNANAPIC
jgi:hypothetical protein